MNDEIIKIGIKMKPLHNLIIALALFGLSASAANAQTIWNIGYPNEADLTATLSEFTYYGYSLTISGNGAMKDFAAGTAPWYNVGTVYNLDIQPGVTTIGNYAFYNVSGLMSDLIIPNTVTSIGASAFENCSYMWAFNNSKVVIPNSVVSIGSYAFKNCCFGIFDVDNANPSYTSDDGVLFDKGKTTLISCLSAKSGDYIVPNTVTSIEDYGCYNSCLSSVTMPNSVTSIGDYAFYQKDGSSGYHPGLTLVSLSDGLTRIGYAAFEYCKFNYIRLPKSLTSLASHAFGNCSNLKTVDVDRDTPLAITSDVFAGMNLSQCTLIVPSGKTALYKAADVWKNFGTFVERVPITGVTLNRTSATITGVGLTLQLTATIAPTNATFQNIIWTSSNPKVATVSDSGLVTSIATGTVIITVTTQDGGYSASCTTSVQYGDGTITDIYLDTYGLRGPNSSSKTIEGFKDPIYCTDFSNGPFKIRVNYSATAPTKTIKIALCVPKKEFAESFATNCYFYDSSQSYLTGSDGGHRFPGLDELEKIKEFVIEANKTTDNVLLLWDAKTDPAFTNGISYPVKDDVWILVTDAKTGEVLQFEPQRWTHVNRLRGGYAFTYTQKANSVVCDIYFTSQIPIKKAVPFIGDDCTFSNADYSQIKKGGVEKIVLSMLYPLEPSSMELSAYKIFDNLSPDENGIYHLSWEIKDVEGNYYDIEKYKYVYEGGYTSYYADFGLYVEGYEQETYGLKLPEYGGKYHGSGDYVSILYGTTFPGLLNPNATYPEFDIENGVLLHYHGSGGNVIVPNTVTKISDLAFYKHTAIQTITIPASVTSIDEFAFLNCSGITSFTVAAENQNYCSEAGVIYNKNKTVLVQYPRAKTGPFSIPNSVQTIGDYAFANCDGLTSITIPASVQTIGDCAFGFGDKRSVGLKNVYVNWATPLQLPMYATPYYNFPLYSNVFYYTYSAETYVKNVTLHVPRGTKALYQAANVWKDFIIADDVTGLETISPENLNIFPNPAKDELIVQSEYPVQKVKICDLSGKTVINDQWSTGKSTINVSALSAGIYILKAETAKGIIIKKFIKE